VRGQFSQPRNQLSGNALDPLPAMRSRPRVPGSEYNASDPPAIGQYQMPLFLPQPHQRTVCAAVRNNTESTTSDSIANFRRAEEEDELKSCTCVRVRQRARRASRCENVQFSERIAFRAGFSGTFVYGDQVGLANFVRADGGVVKTIRCRSPKP
jgi:hypothetical protein